MKKVWKVTKEYIVRANEDYVTIHAAYSTFFMFVALFPFLMFLLNLLTLFNVSRELLLQQIQTVAPQYFHGFIKYIVDVIAENSTSLMLSVTVVLAIWSSSSGVYGMMLGLNDVYRTYDPRNYVVKRLLAILYTFLFVTIFALSLFFLVLGNRLGHLIIEKQPAFAGFVDFVQTLKYPFVFVVFALFFLVIYRVFPRIKTRFRDHIIGALFSSAGWLALSYGFSLYVDHFPASMMYGSLAMVVLFLIWMWIGLLIIFLGGEINAMIYDKRHGITGSESRFRVLETIRQRENEIAENRKARLAETMALRKATARQAMFREEKRRLKAEKKAKKKAKSEAKPEDHA